MIRTSSIFGLATSLLCACSSTPPSLEPPPKVPALFHSGEAPQAPYVPDGIRVPAVSMPAAPASRMQTVSEVFGESYALDAVPESWPLDQSTVIVTSVPDGTGPDLRNALLGGFLSAGYQVKDAGTFVEGAFQVNASTPASQGAFQRVVAAESSASTSQQAEIPEERSYPGLESMHLHLSDPTSLWIPDLLSNENLNLSLIHI